LAEAGRSLFERSRLQPEIFVLEIAEAHFSGAADIEREGAVSLICNAAGLAAIVEDCADDVGVEHELNFIPVAGAQFIIRHRKGKLYIVMGKVEMKCRRMRIGRRGDAHQSAAAPQLVARENFSLRVESHDV